jgi:hypothetical protein
VNEIRAALAKLWAKDVPALAQRLNLEIRNQPVAAALQGVAQSAKLDVNLLPGSVEDGTALLAGDERRVTYLDLRHATAAQALEWMLQPLRMTWWLDHGTVVAGTARRGHAESAWVYDVSLIALPSSDEILKAGDHSKRLADAKSAADGFMKAIREASALDSEHVLWYAPGQLLVFATSAGHASMAKLIEDFGDGRAHVPDSAAELHKITAARAASRKDDIAKAAVLRTAARLAWRLRDGSFSLLAGAADGALDVEALTDLQIAWDSKELPSLRDRPAALAALRPCWAITEASRALPKEAELARLATRARDASHDAAAKALQDVAAKPSDAAALLKATYAALAFREDDSLIRKATELLSPASADAPLQAQRAVAAALLAARAPEHTERLAQLVAKDSTGVTGDDMVVLTALACRRAGGKAWSAFRAEAGEILGRQPLPGSVIVLVNRLGGPEVPLRIANNR